MKKDDSLLFDLSGIPIQSEKSKKKKKQLSMLSAADIILKKAHNSELSREFFSQEIHNIRLIGDHMHTDPMETVLLLAILEIGNNGNADFNDLSRFFSISNVNMLSHHTEIDSLLKKKLIHRCYNNSFDRHGSAGYFVSKAVVDAMKNNTEYVAPNSHCETWEDFFCNLDELYGLLDEDDSTHEDHEREIATLFEENQHLRFVKDFQKVTKDLNDNDKALLLLFCMLYIKSEDDEVCPQQWNFIFKHRMQSRRIANALSDGSSALIKRNLIEFANNEGRAMRNTFRLSNSAKMELIPEAYKPNNMKSKYLRISSDIPEKELFYNKEEQRQIDELAKILEPEKFKKVQQKLAAKGLRTGICCLLHGGPGTGKTETTYQLARATGRDIFQVDMTQLRSKWVGDSEKEVQAMFNEYAKRVRQSEKAPILLINEADGILTTRMRGAERSVDKMENAIQNIILQNMEDLEGILIATTNLADNLDPAFERRFLFKIHFDKPCFEAKKSIWKSMLPEISDNEAARLASEFDFSGGQIENICRKKSINDLLADNDTDFNQLHQYCKDELIKKDGNGKPIGFGK